MVPQVLTGVRPIFIIKLPFRELIFFNPDFALGIVMSAETARKSISLEIEAKHRYGEIVNSSLAADFEAV